jgi:IS5 family transposase
MAKVANGQAQVFHNHTLPEVLSHIESSRGKEVKHAVCDRGYRGRKKFGNTDVILPAPPLKRDNRYQRDKKRKRCRRRAAIEPIIGHLKTDFRLTRNFLKGIAGDNINLLMAACAWNMAKWMREAILFLFTLIFRPQKATRSAKKRFSQLKELLGPIGGGFTGLINQNL